MELRVQKIWPYHDTHCAGPAPEPYYALVDEKGKVVATRKTGVEPYDTHMAGKPDTYEYWDFK